MRISRLLALLENCDILRLRGGVVLVQPPFRSCNIFLSSQHTRLIGEELKFKLLAEFGGRVSQFRQFLKRRHFESICGGPDFVRKFEGEPLQVRIASQRTLPQLDDKTFTG